MVGPLCTNKHSFQSRSKRAPDLSLHSGLALADIGFLEMGREGILKALELDPAVFERAPRADECWLLCAKAFAESDPERAVAAFQRATSINPRMALRVNPAWRLADLLKEQGVR